MHKKCINCRSLFICSLFVVIRYLLATCPTNVFYLRVKLMQFMAAMKTWAYSIPEVLPWL